MKGAISHLYLFKFPLDFLNETSKMFQNITSRFRGQTEQVRPTGKVLLNLQILQVVKDESLTQCFMKDLTDFIPKMPDQRESHYNVTTAAFGK